MERDPASSVGAPAAAPAASPRERARPRAHDEDRRGPPEARPHLAKRRRERLSLHTPDALVESSSIVVPRSAGAFPERLAPWPPHHRGVRVVSVVGAAELPRPDPPLRPGAVAARGRLLQLRWRWRHGHLLLLRER